jgi:NADH dehydrogenase FAD-containing subunit
VVEAGERLLPGTPRGLDALIREHCEDLPVRFAMGSAVARVRAREVDLASGERLPFDLCIWSGGARPPALLQHSDLAPRSRDWAAVRSTLQSVAFDNVFVAGDAAALPSPLSKQAFYALQMGECAAGNAERLLAGQRLLDFAASAKPMLATFGDIDTFLVFEGTAFAGTALAAVKEAIYQLTMAQLDPPSGAAALAALGDRLTHGLAASLPLMVSPRRLLRLSRVRVV